MENIDNSFIISSKNCDNFKNVIVGYAIYNNEIYLSWEDSLLEVKDWNLVQGAYVALYLKEESLYLRRDNMGLIRLYFFEKDGYWAISNSFWKMCEQLKEEFALTLNIGYAEALMAHNMTAFVPYESLCNEIRVLSIFDEVKINILSHDIQIENKYELNEQYNLDSVQAFEEIDKWISYWGSVIKSIELTGYNLEIDLSGGYDSRIAYAIAKAAKIDFSKPNVLVYSVRPKELGAKNHFSGDYEIAEKIAQKHNVKLVSSIEKFGKVEISASDRYKIYEDTLADCVNEVFDRSIFYENTLIKWGGYLGETVRGCEANYWKRGLIHRCCINDGAFQSLVPMKYALRAVLEANKKVQQVIGKNDKDSRENALQYTMECYDGAFFGKQIQQYQRVNILCMSPFMDLALRKIQVNENYRPEILFAAILARVCPELLDLPYSSEAGFTKEEIELVMELNEKYPAKIGIQGQKCIKKEHPMFEEHPYVINQSEDNVRSIIIDRFKADDVQSYLVKKFGCGGRRMYELANQRLQRDVFQNETYAAAICSIVKMAQIEEKSFTCTNSSKNSEFVEITWEQLSKWYPEYPAINELHNYISESAQMQEYIKLVKNNTDKKLFLYGAGEYAREMAQLFSNEGREIDGFIVSKTSGPVEIMGKPVMGRDNIVYDKNKMIILPAVSILYLDEVKRAISEITMSYYGEGK